MATEDSLERLVTPYEEALSELARRREQFPELIREIETALGDDVPGYFRDTPFLYLARHVATPNYETLRFLHLVEPLGLRILITQDPDDKFVAHNPLKYALGRMSFCTQTELKAGGGYAERFATARIIDFNEASGKRLKDVNTLWGESLIEFHNRLFSDLCGPVDFSICDESPWLADRFRGQAIEYYKRLLPFFVVHGIMFEDYVLNDRKERAFVEEHILPAFDFVEERFGYRPLITNLVPTSVESGRFWLAYPAKARESLGEIDAQIRVHKPPMAPPESV